MILYQDTYTNSKTLTDYEKGLRQLKTGLSHAKKIQQALLPQKSYLDQWVNESFIYYHPKHDVGGDFYWWDRIGNRIIVIVGDCCGHGISGGFMSILTLLKLSEIIHSFTSITPSEILTCLNREIIDLLQQEDDAALVKYDSADLGVCIFDISDHTLAYAGAYRPLIIIRENELHVIKGNKSSVGGQPHRFGKNRNYTLFKDQLQKGDYFYMYSDGLGDQFGGPHNKKFTTRRLNQLLHNIHHLPAQQQQELIQTELFDWKNGRMQIDDITILGLKVI